MGSWQEGGRAASPGGLPLLPVRPDPHIWRETCTSTKLSMEPGAPRAHAVSSEVREPSSCSCLHRACTAALTVGEQNHAHLQAAGCRYASQTDRAWHYQSAKGRSKAAASRLQQVLCWRAANLSHPHPGPAVVRSELWQEVQGLIQVSIFPDLAGNPRDYCPA